MLSEQVLARWWHPVASSEAMDLLHLLMHVVLYRRIVMAIDTRLSEIVQIQFHAIVNVNPFLPTPPT